MSTTEEGTSRERALFGFLAFMIFALALAALMVALFYNPGKSTVPSGKLTVDSVETKSVKTHEITGMSDVLLNDSLDLQGAQEIKNAALVRTASLGAAPPGTPNPKIDVVDDLNLVSGAALTGLTELQVTGSVTGINVSAQGALNGQSLSVSGATQLSSGSTSGDWNIGGNLTASNFMPAQSFESPASQVSGAPRLVVSGVGHSAIVYDSDLERMAQPQEVLNSGSSIYVAPSRGIVQLTGLGDSVALGSFPGAARLFHMDSTGGNLVVTTVNPQAAFVPPASVITNVSTGLATNTRLSALSIWTSLTQPTGLAINLVSFVENNGDPHVFFDRSPANPTTPGEVTGLPSGGSVACLGVSMCQDPATSLVYASLNNNGQVELYQLDPSVEPLAWVVAPRPNNLPALNATSCPAIVLGGPAVVTANPSDQNVLYFVDPATGTSEAKIFSQTVLDPVDQTGPRYAFVLPGTNHVVCTSAVQGNPNTIYYQGMTVGPGPAYTNETFAQLSVPNRASGRVEGGRVGIAGSWRSKAETSAVTLIMRVSTPGVTSRRLKDVTDGLEFTPSLDFSTATGEETAAIATESSDPSGAPMLMWFDKQTGQLHFGPSEGCPTNAQFMPQGFNGVYF